MAIIKQYQDLQQISKPASVIGQAKKKTILCYFSSLLDLLAWFTLSLLLILVCILFIIKLLIFKGSCTDKQLWDFLENTEWIYLLDVVEAIMADRGFVGIDRDHQAIIPLKGKLSFTGHVFNSAVSSMRSKVENVLGEIQQWAICRDVFQMEHRHHSIVWEVCSGLQNLKRRGWVL